MTGKNYLLERSFDLVVYLESFWIYLLIYNKLGDVYRILQSSIRILLFLKQTIEEETNLVQIFFILRIVQDTIMISLFESDISFDFFSCKVMTQPLDASGGSGRRQNSNHKHVRQSHQNLIQSWFLLQKVSCGKKLIHDDFFTVQVVH